MNKNRWLAIVTLLVALSLLVGQVAAAPPRSKAWRRRRFSHLPGRGGGARQLGRRYNDDLDQYLWCGPTAGRAACTGTSTARS